MAASGYLSQYFAQLSAAIGRSLPPVSSVSVTPLETSQPFFWMYESGAGVFNAGTFDSISGRVGPGDFPDAATLAASGTFPNAYVQLAAAIAYTLGTADQADLAQAQRDAAVQGNAVVGAYQGSFGAITPDQMAAAGVTTKLDYVITWMVAAQWSGAVPPLSWSAMTAAPDLAALLPKMPAAGKPTVTAVQAYLAATRPIAGIMDRLTEGQWLLATAKANATDPTAGNGGMQLVDPQTGGLQPGWQVGYGVTMPVSEIDAGLADTSRVIQVVVDIVSNGDDPILHFTPEDPSEPPTVFSSADVQRITTTFTGFALVPVAPSAFQSTGATGWYTGDPIAQAVANAGKDVTGYRYTANPPPFDAAPGGNCGMLSHVLIANPPTIHMEQEPTPTVAVLFATAPQTSPGALTLFGRLPLLGKQPIYARQPPPAPPGAQPPAAASPLRFVAAAPSASASPLMMTAQIVAGAIVWPG